MTEPDATPPPEQPADTDPIDTSAELSALVRQAVLEALASGGALPLAAPPEAQPLAMTITPNLGLKQPGMDDPALVTDLNDNFGILDGSITATQAVTLTNKTLDAPIVNNPTINGWANAQHTHLNASGGGGLDGTAIVSGYSGTGNLLRESGAGFTDPVVRDILSFGAKPSGAADATLRRTSAGALQLSGAANSFLAVRSTGATSSVRFGQAVATPRLDLSVNGYFDGTNWMRDDTAKGGAWIYMNGGAASGDTFLLVQTALPGANPVTPTNRLSLNGAGTFTVNADAGAAALIANMGSAALWITPGGSTNSKITTTVGNLELGSQAGYIHPPTTMSIRLGAVNLGWVDVCTASITAPTSNHVSITGTGQGHNLYMRSFGSVLMSHMGGGWVGPETDNTFNCGTPGVRWNTMYSVNGVNASSRDLKTDIAPLDPAAGMAAVRATQPVSFRFKAPPADEYTYALPDDPEEAEQRLLQRLTSAPLEEAAREQVGFVAEEADPLFLVGAGQISPNNSVGVLLAALHDLDARLSALETP